MNQRMLESLLIASGVALVASGVAAHVRALDRAARPTPRVSADRVPAESRSPSNTFAVVDARVFDGTSVVERATVLVEGGLIKSVGPGPAVPQGVPVVNAFGKTLLPGLIDAHTHAFEDALERALAFGVTTEIDMFTDAGFAAARRDEQKRGVVTSRADILSAGTLATSPGGHGTEYGMPIPTLTRPDEAQAFVDARVAEGSDFIKIVYDDLASYGLKLPTLSRETMAAVVAAAHRRGKLAVVHVSTARAAREAIEAGANGLAHVFADVPADAEMVELARRHGIFLVPTLAVIASTFGETAGAQAIAADSSLGLYVWPADRRSLNAAFPARRRDLHGMDNARASVAAMRGAGVPILAGTDAPNPGTAHGLSLHQELEALVGAGLTPTEALASATSIPARTFGLADRGRIEAGLRADLVLVDGDPTRTITTTRRIAAIWKGGVPVARKPAPADAVPAPVATDGLVSEFESDVSSRFGFGWQISTDAMMGGTSEAAMRVVPGGAGGSRGSLEIVGSIKPGSMFPWAGPMFFPGPQPMSPANLSRFKELVFWTKGDGGAYRVLLFAASLGRIPSEQRFTAGAEWREVVMPLTAFGRDLTGTDLQAVLFSGSAGQDHFRLQIDRVRFR
jgi:imidazolonepropionase-like amidohydrolase